jgi:hypothetical protein
MGLLKRSGRVGKMVFRGLDMVLRSYPGGMPEALPSVLIPQIKSFLSQLSLLALLFKLTPTTTFPEIESDLLLDVYLIVHSLTVVSDCVHSGDICVSCHCLNALTVPVVVVLQYNGFIIFPQCCDNIAVHFRLTSNGCVEVSRGTSGPARHISAKLGPEPVKMQ